MAKKNITIDDLAVMVQKGFGETAKKYDMDLRFEEVDKRFDAIDKRFDRVEHLILENHKKRLEKLETEVKELKELFAMK
ncbi:MAG: hypothetical protein NTY04_04210 [Candidatus Staskawiczbacteria bacterium]|nr:hypothetical protein [Candidatus Staskawiczbacteria bacterium]